MGRKFGISGQEIVEAITSPSATATNTSVEFGDSASLDASSRLRTSDPLTLFESKLLFDAEPLLWDDAEVSGGGTSSTHSTDTSSVTMAVSAATAGKRVRQTKAYFNYEPGKSQNTKMTFIPDLTGGGRGIARRFGYFDANNGLFLEDNAGTYNLVRRTKTSGSVVNNKAAQAAWNLDVMDGTGASGINLNFSKVQQLITDFEWLSVGRIRFGFKVGGKIIYVHQIQSANVLSVPFMSSPNLPLRIEIENDGTGVASSLMTICDTVISEGGNDDIGETRYVSNGDTSIAASVSGTVYALLGIRLKSTHIAADVRVVAKSILCDKDYEWKLIMNPTVAGTFAYSNVTDAAIQVATGATANAVTGGTDLGGSYGSTGKVNETGFSVQEIENELRLGSLIDGTVDTIVLCVRPLAATATAFGSLGYKEAT